jgi:hypothetical protein
MTRTRNRRPLAGPAVKELRSLQEARASFRLAVSEAALVEG